jgi:basic membrane lipoprotein Med (substrate-binding protein (PBP1-ABC) superfamily)
MVFEHRQILSAESAPENLQLVIVLPPANDLAELAAALPETKFVALNVPGVTSRGNLVSVGGERASDAQAFMAGYIAAVQSDDWRVGLIYLGDEAGRTYQNAFLSGAIYFCGFCNPYFPPYYEYPVYYEVPVGSSVEAFQVAADDLIAKGVNTVHLAPGTQREEIFRYLAEGNIRFVGTESPPAGLETNWIASVVASGEVDLRQVVNQVLNGQVDIEANASIQITYTGLSEARVTHYNEVLQELVSGVIDPQGVDIE